MFGANPTAGTADGTTGLHAARADADRVRVADGLQFLQP